jgi:hypothetical protein
LAIEKSRSSVLTPSLPPPPPRPVSPSPKSRAPAVASPRKVRRVINPGEDDGEELLANSFYGQPIQPQLTTQQSREHLQRTYSHHNSHHHHRSQSMTAAVITTTATLSKSSAMLIQRSYELKEMKLSDHHKDSFARDDFVH